MSTLFLILKIYLVGIPIIGLILSLLTTYNDKFYIAFIAFEQKQIEEAKNQFSDEDKALLDMVDYDAKDHIGFLIFSHALYSWLAISVIIEIFKSINK